MCYPRAPARSPRTGCGRRNAAAPSESAQPRAGGGWLPGLSAEPGACQHGHRGDPQGASRAPSAPGPREGDSTTPGGGGHREAGGSNLGSRGCCSFAPLRFHFLPPDFFFSFNEIPLPIWTQPPLLSWARWKGERRGGILNLLWRV